jgi:hypothetical protein
MKLTSQQLNRIVQLTFEKWKKNNVVTFKADESLCIARAVKALQDDLQKEIDLERDVNKMLDQLEKSNPGEFQRYKMYPMLKRQLAKEKKVIL